MPFIHMNLHDVKLNAQNGAAGMIGGVMASILQMGLPATASPELRDTAGYMALFGAVALWATAKRIKKRDIKPIALALGIAAAYAAGITRLDYMDNHPVTSGKSSTSLMKYPPKLTAG